MIYQNEDVANESVVWVAMCSDIELRVQILCQNQFYTRYFMGYLDALIVKKLWFHFFLNECGPWILSWSLQSRKNESWNLVIYFSSFERPRCVKQKI